MFAFLFSELPVAGKMYPSLAAKRGVQEAKPIMQSNILENILETLCDADDLNRHALQTITLAEAQQLGFTLSQSDPQSFVVA